MKVILNENSLKKLIGLIKEDSAEDYSMDDNIDMDSSSNIDVNADDDKFDIRKDTLIKQANRFMSLFNGIKSEESKLSDNDIIKQIRDRYKTDDKLGMIINQDDPLQFAQLVLDDDKFADSVAQTKMIQKKSVDTGLDANPRDIKGTYARIKERIPEVFNKSYNSLTFYELAMILRKIQREFAGEKNASEFLENIVKRTKDLMVNKYKEADYRIKHYTIYSEDKHAKRELSKVGIPAYAFKTVTPNGQEIIRMYVGTNGELTAVAKELPGQRIISMDLHGYGNGKKKMNENRIKNIISECVDKFIKESYAKDGNYTHFAVNKDTKKIVNGWDYHGYDPEELRQFKKDYFTVDLIDYELDPKQYTILTAKGCMQKGIDPNDDSNWEQK